MDATPTTAEVAEQILGCLREQQNPDNVAGMARYGITPGKSLGVPMTPIRQLARDGRAAFGRDRAAWHQLALALWDLEYREARLCAAFTDHPSQVTREQMEAWVADFDSWDICDGVCMHLFSRSDLAWEQAYAWSAREEQYVKRAGFVLVASLATHDKSAPDSTFTEFLPVIEREASDERNFVKKAVNWALRHIGKRNAALNPQAIACAERLLAEQPNSASARWIARDALRELRGEKVRARLGLA